jgi:hypothetical protein
MQGYDRSAAALVGLSPGAVVDASDKSDGEIEIVVTRNVPPYPVAGNPARNRRSLYA